MNSLKYRLSAVVVALSVLSCGKGGPQNLLVPPPVTKVPTVPVPTAPGQAVFIFGGDLAEDNNTGTIAVSNLLTNLIVNFPDPVFATTGDNAYPGMTEVGCQVYKKYFGVFLSITYPTPGNHDIGGGDVGGTSYYFECFGERAGPYGLGYYSYTKGPCVAYALNSETAMYPGSPQSSWLRFELERNRGRKCQLAYWHRPRWSNGPNLDNPDVQPLLDLLYEYRVQIVVNGHDHLYERFEAQTPREVIDPCGIRQFTVGTGGMRLYDFRGTQNHNPRLQLKANGLLVIVASGDGYDWHFFTTDGLSIDNSVGGNAFCGVP